MAYLTTTYDSNGFFNHKTNDVIYSGYKPNTYQENTPITLLIWGHGCGGQMAGDLWVINPPSTRQNQNYIGVSLGGKDGACWDADNDYKKVLACIEDVKKYFNIGKIILGGYSSGGDLAYYTAFYHSDKIAGVVINNSSPFKDTSSTPTASLNAAKYKFNVYQMSHTNDTTYKINEVKAEIQILKNAGFPVQFVELPGTHWDPTTATSGTNFDFIKYALPVVNNNNWTMPNTSPPVVVPPVSKVLANFAAPTVSVAQPTDQSFKFWKNIPDGYSNVVKGDYCLEFAVRNTWSSQNTVCMNITIYNPNKYNCTWEECVLDLRNHTLANYGNCTIVGNAGSVVVKPSASIATIPAYSKMSFNLCINRAKDTTAYYSVLVKSVKW